MQDHHAPQEIASHNNITFKMSENETISYCLPGADEFHKAYYQIHGYVALVICSFGIIANSVNIAVLSRREMASSTNSILTGLAVADLLVMLEYIPFALHIYVQTGSGLNRNTYAWAVFVYFHSIFSQTFHTISIWLTITLAVWRYIAIKLPQRNRTWCDKKNTTIAIAGAYATCPVLCLPIFFAMNIVQVNKPISEVTDPAELEYVNGTAPNATAVMYALSMSENETLVMAIFWIYSVILKLIPCIVLSFLSVCLIMKMKSSEKRRQKLLKKSTLISSEAEKTRLHEEGGGGGGGGGGGRKAGAGRTDRTTRMLVVLLGLFLLTEVPQGLFGLLSAIAPHFFEICYSNFGEVMDLLALVGSAINFVLYCSMSRQFRSTFGRLARKAILRPDGAKAANGDGVTQITVGS